MRCQVLQSIAHLSNFGIDYSAKNTAQESDEVKAYRTAITGLTLQDVKFGVSDKTILGYISTGKRRPIVPLNFHRKVFEAIHNIPHPSIRSLQDLVVNKFMWHGLKKKVGAWQSPALVVKRQKCIDMSRFPKDISIVSMWIWLVLSLSLMVNDTFSP